MSARRKALLFSAVLAGLAASSALVARGAYTAYTHRFAAAEWPRQWRYTAYYWLKPGVRGLLTELAGMYDSGTFSTVWDSTIGVHLSRTVYAEELIDGRSAYAPRPGASKVMFALRVWGAQVESYEAPATPAVRAHLARARPFYQTEASYDEHGFRNTGLSDPGLPAIFFLGDSYADGYAVADGEAFPALVGASALRAGLGFPVNAGVNGYGPREELHALEKARRARGLPRLVVLQHFPNDIFGQYDAVVAGDFPDASRLWAEHDALFRRLTRRCRDWGVPLLVVAVPPKAQAYDPAAPTRHYQERLARLCRQEGAAFLDPLAAIRAAGPQRLYFSWDPHLNADGHRLLAAEIWRAAEPLLR